MDAKHICRRNCLRRMMNLKGWTKLSAQYNDSILYLNVGLHYVLILPWFGCHRHFSQTNKLLEKAGHLPIDWQLWNYNLCILATYFPDSLLSLPNCLEIVCLTYMGMMCCTSVQLLESFSTNLPSQKAIGMCHASVQLFEFSHKFAFTKGYRVCHISVQLFEFSHTFAFTKGYRVWQLLFIWLSFPIPLPSPKATGCATPVQLFEFSHTFAFTKGDSTQETNLLWYETRWTE